MGTRSIIVVTGKSLNASNHNNLHDGEKETIRLYKHWDGYPTYNLRVILQAIRAASSLAAQHRREVTDISSKVMADLITAASISWYTGALATIDEADDSSDHKAVYLQPLRRKHFGNQADLEWLYVVDIENTKITVYGGNYGSPEKHLRRGPVDPKSYAGHLKDAYQTKESTAIAMAMDQIMEEGWTITAPKHEEKHDKTGSVRPRHLRGTTPRGRGRHVNG